MLLTGCVRWRDVGDSLNIPVIMIIVASLSLGMAMEKTGGAQFIAELFVAATSTLPVPMIVSGMMLLMTLLTNVVSNNAAAVIGTPIAISVAYQLGVSPEPFILAVIFRRQHEFRHADRLSDQPPDHVCRRLQILGLPARGHSAHPDHVDRVFLRSAGTLRPVAGWAGASRLPEPALPPGVSAVRVDPSRCGVDTGPMKGMTDKLNWWRLSSEERVAG